MVLEWLYLYENDIKDEGAGRLADGLRCNAALTWLDLTHNRIGREGADLLADRLQSNTALKILDVGWEPPRIQQMLDRNDRLRRYAIKYRKLVFAWCAQVGAGLPLEIIEMVVRQSKWNHQLLPRELQVLLNAESQEIGTGHDSYTPGAVVDDLPPLIS
eukprot:TRINITY_DN737_c1_g1_i3.p1 TRINITY_DN737_c1_g1~~TRINITY_DN737_c1_g1_i3.p1  ORF type:complete len:159 (+),score=20.67 TRINITY_DN737_c1_g1_i3:419-895(+)